MFWNLPSLGEHQLPGQLRREAEPAFKAHAVPRNKRLPSMWNCVTEKEAFNFNELEHV
jgi:hypothetical protein